MHLDPRRRPPTRAPRPSRARRRLHPEPLEPRQLLSGASTLPVAPAAVTAAARISPPPTTDLSPATVRAAYAFDGIAFNNGTVVGDGRGQTIAIVEAYHDPNVAGDLAAFDAYYQLPAANLRVVGQDGGAAPTATDAGWAQETALDVEWAHAIAPGANILLVEANSPNLRDMMAAVDTAAAHANVVSMSWGSPEFAGETALDAHFNVPGVTFVAASGDSGAVSWPAASPYVVGVGGTSLSVGSGGTWGGETPWNDGPFGGSGGGVSAFEPAPAYQQALTGGAVANRTSPDVSYNAAGQGFPVYNSFGTDGSTAWQLVGGTSAGAPQWAALLAIADQGRALASPTLAPLGSQQTLSQLLYGRAAADPAAYFHTVAGGGGRTTGLGSPIAVNLVALATGGQAASGALGTSATAASPGGPVGPPSPHGVRPVSAPALVVFQVIAPGIILVIQVPTALLPLAPLNPAPAASATAPSSVSASIATATAPAPVRPAQPLFTTASLDGLDLDLAPADRLPYDLFWRMPALIPGEGLPELPLEIPVPVVPAVPAPIDPAPAAPAPEVPRPAAPAKPAPALPEPTDEILEAYVLGASPAVIADRSPSAPVSRFESALMAGAAVAAWGAWEVRSRHDVRRRRNWFRPR